jgi:hypothetical protein
MTVAMMAGKKAVMLVASTDVTSVDSMVVCWVGKMADRMVEMTADWTAVTKADPSAQTQAFGKVVTTEFD